MLLLNSVGFSFKGKTKKARGSFINSMQAEPSNEGPLIAGEAELQAFASQPGLGLNEALRGVLAETALTGRVRYDWQLLKPLLHSLIDGVLSDYAAEEQVEVGPPRPMPGGGSLEGLQSGLHELLSSFAEAPFTVQRLCEVLLEPRKQYQRLDKLAAAIEKLLLVTSTCTKWDNLPPRPALSSLGPVNNNPPSPYLPTAPSSSGGGGGGGSGSSAQQAAQSLLPNGREEDGDGSPTGSHLATGRASAVFRMFMHAEAATAAASGGSSAAVVQGTRAAGVSNGTLAEEAAEAELAKQFVEDALRTDPEPVGVEQGPAQPTSPGAASPAPDGSTAQGPIAQLAGAAGVARPEQQQQALGGGGEAPVTAGAGVAATAQDGGKALAAISAEQQQAPQPAPREELGVAMDIDAPSTEAGQGGSEQGTGAGVAAHAAGGEGV